MARAVSSLPGACLLACFLLSLGCGTSAAEGLYGRGDGGMGGPDSTTPPASSDASLGGHEDAPVGSGDASAPPPPPAGAACGYLDAGVTLHVASGLDVCLPKVACNAETCPPQLGDCVNDACVFRAGYEGVATFPEAWVTYYCDLTTGGCHGVTQIQYPEVTAQQIASAKGLPLCDAQDGGTGECVGVAASSAMVVGNSQLAVDSLSGKQVKDWGLGLTEASGLCYELTGPGGTVLVALTDRCGGYCKCNGSGFQECGPCINAADMEVNCPCVGTAPPAYTGCCGTGAACGTLSPQCDWCASNSHPHFDLDIASFNRICGSLAVQGSCQLSRVSFAPCLTPSGWPP
jgi:hypothetical protein